jgi:DNA-binding NarL/FixJ family response regulator
LHLSSRAEARGVSDRPASKTLNARAGPRSERSDNGRFVRFIKEVCPSAPIDIEPSADKPSRSHPSASDAAGDRETPLNGAEARSEGSEPESAGAGAKRPGAAKQRKPTIVVIHRRAVFRDCFVRCLEVAYKDHNVCSFARVADWSGSADPAALAAAVVIVVVESGDASSVADLEVLESNAGKLPVIVVSDIDDLDHIVGTLKRGARGYIPSSLPFNIAVEAVRLVEAGGVFVPASSFVDREKQPAAAKNGIALTERQMKVLEEIRHGKANKQIAYELNMSEHTVKVHLRHIMRKLKARNRTEVAVLSESLLIGPKN